ncbi:MAG: hypothetical protein ABWY11_21410 [Umezawaea sp.]
MTTRARRDARLRFSASRKTTRSSAVIEGQSRSLAFAGVFVDADVTALTGMVLHQFGDPA